MDACWLAGTSSPEPAAFLRPDTFPEPCADRFHVLFSDPGGVERGKKVGEAAEEEDADAEAAEEAEDEDEAEDDARDAAVAEAEEASEPLPNVLAYPSQSGQDTHPMSRYVRCGLLGIVFGRSPRLLYASQDFLLRSFSERAKARASAKGSAVARFRLWGVPNMTRYRHDRHPWCVRL